MQVQHFEVDFVPAVVVVDFPFQPVDLEFLLSYFSK
jgi:hypothetical protein